MRKHLRVCKLLGFKSAKPTKNTATAQFDEAYLHAVKMLEAEVKSASKPKKLKKFHKIDFAVELTSPSVGVIEREIALGKFFPPDNIVEARMVVYCAPIKARTSSKEELASLIHDVIGEPVLKYLKL